MQNYGKEKTKTDEADFIDYGRNIIYKIDDLETEHTIPPNATTILRITDLKRPFTLDEFLDMLRKIVFIEKDQYWINRNRSIAYVQYKNLIESVRAYKSL